MIVGKLQIEIYGGTSIENASETAQRMADLLGLGVEFKFNDVRCLAVPQGSAQFLVERQQLEQSRALEPFKPRFASSRVEGQAVESNL